MADLLTWAPDIDNDAADYSTTALLTKYLMLNMVDMLLGIPGVTCEGSCDGSTAGMDGVNRWTDASKVIRASSGARSWIALGGLIRICIHLNGTGESQPGEYAFAKAAFTGGTTSARPTSPDEWVYTAGGSNALHDNTASLFRTHMVCSTRGDFWMWNHKVGLSNPATQPTYFAMAATQIVPFAGVTDDYPVVTFIAGGAYGFRYAELLGPGSGTVGWRGRNAHGAAPTLVGATMTSMSSYPLAYIPSAGGYVTKSFPRLPLQIWTYDGSANGYSDYKGSVVDVQVGPWGMRPGAPDVAGAPTRKLYGSLWLPGLNSVEPGY